MPAFFQGIKSDVRTSSGMFLSPEEKKYPMIQVCLLFYISDYNIGAQFMDAL